MVRRPLCVYEPARISPKITSLFALALGQVLEPVPLRAVPGDPVEEHGEVFHAGSCEWVAGLLNRLEEGFEQWVLGRPPLQFERTVAAPELVRAGEAGAIVKVLTAAINHRFPIRGLKPTDFYYDGGRRTPMESDKAAMRAGMSPGNRTTSPRKKPIPSWRPNCRTPVGHACTHAGASPALRGTSER